MDLMERVRRSCEDGLISTITSQKHPNSNINNELTNKYNQFVKTLDEAEKKLLNLLPYSQTSKNNNINNGNYSLPNINFKSLEANNLQNITQPSHQSFTPSITRNPSIQNSLNISRSRSLIRPKVSTLSNITPLNISRNSTIAENYRSRSPLINLNDTRPAKNNRTNNRSNTSQTSASSNISNIIQPSVNNKRGRQLITSTSSTPSSVIQTPRNRSKTPQAITSVSPSDVSRASAEVERRKVLKKKKEYNLRKRDPAVLQKMKEQLKSSSDSSINLSRRSRSPLAGPSQEKKSFNDWSHLYDTDTSYSTSDSNTNKPQIKKKKRNRIPTSSSSSSHNDISYIINQAKRRKILKKKPKYNLRKRDPELLRKLREQLKSSSDSSFLN